MRHGAVCPTPAKRTAALVAAFCVWMAAGCATRSPEHPNGPHFSVLTYNLNIWAPAAERSISMLGQADADIVFLQEITPAWQELLEAEFASRYPHIGFMHDEASGGLAAMSRMPFRQVAYVPSQGKYSGWLLDVDTPVGVVQMLAVHLHAPLDDFGVFTIGAFLGRGKERLSEIRSYYAHVDPARPLIVLGDFNEPEDGQAVRFLKDRGMTSALGEFDRLTPTWGMWVGFIPLSSRLDHILYSPDLYCFEAFVRKGGGSDHDAVEAVFGLPVASQASPTREDR